MLKFNHFNNRHENNVLGISLHDFSMKTLANSAIPSLYCGHDKAPRTQKASAARTGLSTRGLGSMVECCRSAPQALMSDGTLTKLTGGLYLYPKETVFGKAPPKIKKLVGSLFKRRPFSSGLAKRLQQLGVGTTQLYDKTVVYNHKRHGNFALGGRKFDFRIKPSFPKKLSKEFLLVDLVNNLDRLAESKEEVLARVKERAVIL